MIALLTVRRHNSSGVLNSPDPTGFDDCLHSEYADQMLNCNLARKHAHILDASSRLFYRAMVAGIWREASVMTIANLDDSLSATTGYLTDIHLEYSCLFK